MVRPFNKCLRPLHFLLTSSYVHGVKYTSLTKIESSFLTISQSSEESDILVFSLFWASAGFSLDQDPSFQGPFFGYLFEVVPSHRVGTRVASLR